MTQEGAHKDVLLFIPVRYRASSLALYYICCFLCVLDRLSGPCSRLTLRQGRRRMCDRLEGRECGGFPCALDRECGDRRNARPDETHAPEKQVILLAGQLI